MRKCKAAAILAAVLPLMAGCVSRAPAPAVPAGDVLRVGVSPDYPPIIFRQAGKVSGLEADLAADLAAALGRRLVFVEVPWEKQIGELLAGRTDIIMSGMSVTEARGIRITFSDPYLRVGLMPLVRSKDADRYDTKEKITASDARIGIQKNSTADMFVQRECKASAVVWLEPRDAPFYLVNRKIDVFINDGPAVVWLAAENEADLAVAQVLLSDESLAWGMRKNDLKLLSDVNDILAGWKKDGVLDAVLKRWMPDFVRYK